MGPIQSMPLQHMSSRSFFLEKFTWECFELTFLALDEPDYRIMMFVLFFHSLNAQMLGKLLCYLLSLCFDCNFFSCFHYFQ